MYCPPQQFRLPLNFPYALSHSTDLTSCVNQGEDSCRLMKIADRGRSSSNIFLSPKASDVKNSLAQVCDDACNEKIALQMDRELPCIYEHRQCIDNHHSPCTPHCSRDVHGKCPFYMYKYPCICTRVRVHACKGKTRLVKHKLIADV